MRSSSIPRQTLLLTVQSPLSTADAPQGIAPTRVPWRLFESYCVGVLVVSVGIAQRLAGENLDKFRADDCHLEAVTPRTASHRRRFKSARKRLWRLLVAQMIVTWSSG